MITRIYNKLQSQNGLILLGSVTLFFAMFALLGLGVMAFSHHSDSDAAPATISVSGTGEVFATPDVATFSATIQADDATMGGAEKTATAGGNALLSKLEAAGVAKADIQTTDFSANPKYENQAVAVPMIGCAGAGCPPPVTNSVIVGYTVSQTYSIKVRNLDSAGDIAKLLTDANVSDVSGPNFAIDKPENVQNQARDKAIADAKQQAQILASQLGVHLKGIVDFQVSNGSPIYPMAYSMKAGMAADAAAPSPVLNPGQSDITSNVTITYKIK